MYVAIPQRDEQTGTSMYHVILFDNNKNKFVDWDFCYLNNALLVMFYWYETELKNNVRLYKRVIPICIKKHGRVIARCSNYEDSYKYVLKSGG